MLLRLTFLLLFACFCPLLTSLPPDISCVSASPRWRALKDFSIEVSSVKNVNTTVCSSIIHQFSDLYSSSPNASHPCPIGLLTLQTLRVLYSSDSSSASPSSSSAAQPPQQAEETVPPNYQDVNLEFENLHKIFRFFILQNKLFPQTANSAWPLIFASEWPLFELLARLHEAVRPSGMVQAFESRCGADSEENRRLWRNLRFSMDAAMAELRNERAGSKGDKRGGIVRLSERGREKWSSIYVGNFTVSARLADEAFSAFNAEWWKQDCICGFMAIYLYRSVPFLVREKEGWAGRFFSGMNALMNEAGLREVIESEWPVFEILTVIKKLRRGDKLGEFHQSIFPIYVEPVISTAIGKFVLTLQHAVPETAEVFASSRISSLRDLTPLQRLVFLADKYDANLKLVYIVPVYGEYSRFLPTWLLQAQREIALIAVIALDDSAFASCSPSLTTLCLPLSGILPASVISKYVVAEVFLSAGFDVVLLDLDTWIFSDPTQRLFETSESAPDVVLPSFYLTDNLNPFFVFYRSSPLGLQVVQELKTWLFVNPFGEEHLAFDAILGHRAWDVYIKNYQDKSNLSWRPSTPSVSPSGGGGRAVKFGILDSKREFVSADGWLQRTSPESTMKVFHFWGAEDKSVETLFECLSSSSSSSSSVGGEGGEGGVMCISEYRKQPQWWESARVPEDFNLVAISYASGCCMQAQRLNAETALKSGANSTRSFGASDVDEEFKRVHAEIWNQPRGGGYWIWKPYLILKTLVGDEAVKWGDVVVYLDAGNHYRVFNEEGGFFSLREKIRRLLSETDVSGGYLKCCIESDWTKRDALVLLNGDKSSILDRPQMAAYFLLFRKTPRSIAFVQEWLQACTDPRIVSDLPNVLGLPNHPTFTNHIHDQAAFSILFKHFGFKGFDLDEAHEVMKLARWRE